MNMILDDKVGDLAKMVHEEHVQLEETIAQIQNEVYIYDYLAFAGVYASILSLLNYRHWK